jgi:hypothetical protein
MQKKLKMQEKLKCMNKIKNDAERGADSKHGSVKMKQMKLGLGNRLGRVTPVRSEPSDQDPTA